MSLDTERSMPLLPSLYTNLFKYTPHAHVYTCVEQCISIFSLSGYLIKLLEIQSCRLEWNEGFIQQTFRKVGMSLETLLDIYNKLMQANVRTTLQFTCSMYVHVRL